MVAVVVEGGCGGQNGVCAEAGDVDEDVEAALDLKQGLAWNWGEGSRADVVTRSVLVCCGGGGVGEGGWAGAKEMLSTAQGRVT